MSRNGTIAAVLLLFLSAAPLGAQLRKINIAYTATSPYQAVLIVAKIETYFEQAALTAEKPAKENKTC